LARAQALHGAEGMTRSLVWCSAWSLARAALVAFAVMSLAGCGGFPFSSGDASPESFQRLELRLGGGPCTEEMDCSGFYELLADGTFRVDRFGEYGGGVHEVTLSREELEATLEQATDSALLKVMRRGEYPCGQVTDASSYLTLELEDERREAQLAGCNEPSVQALRQTLKRLDDTYVK
jgi:hypothetical protein